MTAHHAAYLTTNRRQTGSKEMTAGFIAEDVYAPSFFFLLLYFANSSPSLYSWGPYANCVIVHARESIKFYSKQDGEFKGVLSTARVYNFESKQGVDDFLIIRTADKTKRAFNEQRVETSPGTDIETGLTTTTTVV